jgi:hypothetical protein
MARVGDFVTYLGHPCTVVGVRDATLSGYNTLVSFNRDARKWVRSSDLERSVQDESARDVKSQGGG